MQKIFFRSSKPRFIEEESIIEQFRNLAKNIAASKTDVERIYLFGSLAKRNASFYSDADILAILAKDNRSMKERLDEYILAFSDGPVPADVLVYTKNEIQKAQKEGNKFLRQALEGIVLV